MLWCLRSVCTVDFKEKGGSDEIYLAVGTAKDLCLDPRTMTAGFIHIYKFVNGGASLQLLHKVGAVTVHFPEFIVLIVSSDVAASDSSG